MRRIVFILFFCFVSVTLTAVPGYIDFQLNLTFIHHSPGWFTTIMGELTVTNNGPEPWQFSNNLGYLGHIRINGEATLGTFWIPYNLTLPPQQSYTTELMGEAENLGQGVHQAQAALSYTMSNWEMVGNSVPFSVDNIMSDFADLIWDIVVHEHSSEMINASLRGVNDSYFFWKRSFPYDIEMLFGLDGNIPNPAQNPAPHNVFIGPGSTRFFDATCYLEEPLSPGYHSLQAYIMEDPPIPVGNPYMFYVQGSEVDNDAMPCIPVASLYPNPLRTNSVIRITSPEVGSCEVSVYNTRGQCIARRTNINLPKGTSEIPLSSIMPADAGAGVYLIRVKTPPKVMDIKAIILR